MVKEYLPTSSSQLSLNNSVPNDGNDANCRSTVDNLCEIEILEECTQLNM